MDWGVVNWIRVLSSTIEANDADEQKGKEPDWGIHQPGAKVCSR